MALRLIKEVTYPEPEDVTDYFINELKKGNINVEKINSPIQGFTTETKDITVEMVTKIIDDIDYAIKQVIEYKPLLFIIREITKFYDVTGAHYKIRFNFIKLGLSDDFN